MTLTVSTLRAALQRLESEGKGTLPVLVCCDVDPDNPEGTCPFGVVTHPEMVLLDYTAQPGSVSTCEGE